MVKTLQLANNPIMWILSLSVIGVVIVQTIIFYVIAKNYVKKTNILTDKQLKKALKIGAIGTIGPAIAVFAVAVALISQIGGPITLARIGVIGSAAFEMISANIGSAGTLGTNEFSPQMLATAAWVMIFGGAGWLIMVLFTTKQLNKMQETLKDKNPLTVAYMASFAPFVIFFTLSYNHVSKDLNKGSFANLAALIAGALAVAMVNLFVKKNPNKKWLKEWAMAFSVVAAMIVGSFVKASS